MVVNEHIDVVVMGTASDGFSDHLLTDSSIERVIDKIAADFLITLEPPLQGSDK